MKDINEKLCFNTKEAVHLLGINRNLLDSFRRRGLIRYVKMGRNYLYPKNELERFVSDNLGNEISKEGIILVERQHE